MKKYCCASLAAVVAIACVPFFAYATVSKSDNSTSKTLLSSAFSNIDIDVPVIKASINRQSSELHSIVVDDVPRVVGGDVDLSNAVNKQLPKQKFPFNLDAKTLSKALNSGKTPVLTIGSIQGLNTPEAHEAGESQADYISSPSVIKINGVKVGYVYTSQNGLQIKVHKKDLRPDGYNTIQIEAGYYFTADNRLAYDTVSFQDISIEFNN